MKMNRSRSSSRIAHRLQRLTEEESAVETLETGSPDRGADTASPQRRTVLEVTKTSYRFAGDEIIPNEVWLAVQRKSSLSTTPPFLVLEGSHGVEHDKKLWCCLCHEYVAIKRCYSGHVNSSKHKDKSTDFKRELGQICLDDFDRLSRSSELAIEFATKRMISEIPPADRLI